MNKSLLEILEEEKRVLRNVKSLKDLRDGILEMAKSEIVESKIQSCFRIAKNYEKKTGKGRRKTSFCQKGNKRIFFFFGKFIETIKITRH